MTASRASLLTLFSGLLISVWGCTPGAPTGNDNTAANQNENQSNDNTGGGNVNENTGENVNENGDEEPSASFVAELSGGQEVAPVETEAVGAAALFLNAAQTQVTFQISAAGLSGTVVGAHFHIAPLGENGMIVFNFTDLVQQQGDMVTINGVWDLEETSATISIEDAVAALFSDGLYANLHTENFPTGEIRGQILFPDDDE